jgi:hypothetical protein
MRVSRILFVFFLAASLLAPLPIHSQGIGGSISGTVKEEGGGAVAAAVVKLINQQTGQTRTVSTGDTGRYQIREVPPGVYDITVERPGFNTARVESVRVSVAQVARLSDIILNVATIGEEKVVPFQADVFLTDTSSPTLSTSFTEKQIRELPVLTRDVNNLALLAPGVFSVRTFSFASTLVPFAANGSRGRDNNFIIDSVDNNEPLFGGAATQFTNTDLFAEYRILTNQYKAEYGRNSGSVVNIITERGGNQWHGSAFFFGQSDKFNAANRVETFAGLSGNTRFYETQAGATLGGPIKKEAAWFFVSYQWDRARNDLSPLYPVVATAPLSSGLAALQAFPSTPTLQAFLSSPTVTDVPGSNSPCGSASSNLPQTNPCTVGQVTAFNTNTSTVDPIDFGTFLVPRSGVFDVRDHQFSARYDQSLGPRDDIYFRYLFDDLNTPRLVGGAPAEVGFADFGLYPEYRTILRQRTQSLGLFWTRAWATALHELRGSFTRISSETGALEVSDATREARPAVTVLEFFNPGGFATFFPSSNPAMDPCSSATPPPAAQCQAILQFQAAFPAAGQTFTLGRDTKPTRVNSNIFQLQDNFSWSKGINSLKVGGNLVRTQTNVRQIPSDLGQFFYLTFEDFIYDSPILAWQRFPNFRGRGGDVLPVREFAQFYFFQDDIRFTSNFTLSLGVRYENYGQAINKVAELNPGFGPKIKRDDNNIAPRIGFAWSPDGKWVLRGGYGIYYNPTVFNIALVGWQGGRVSPFVARVFVPTNPFPNMPFNNSDVTTTLQPTFGCELPAFFAEFTSDVDCTTADTVNRDLVNPIVQNYSVSLQRQLGRDFLFEISYVGSRGKDLFQRVDRNPRMGWELVDPLNCLTVFFVTTPCQLPRRDINRGGITEVTNGGRSTYQALQVSATHRYTRRFPLAITAAYTWSHMIDNTSEIFGPGVRYVPGQIRDLITGSAQVQTIEAITPFAQDPNNTGRGERGNSAFDRRHRVAISFLYDMPGPDAGAARWFFGDWQLNGLFTAQSGQPFTPVNGVGACIDANGDGVLINDRPLIGNPSAPANSVALLLDCADQNGLYYRPDDPATTFDRTTAFQSSRFVQAAYNTLGDVGRNTLRGPNTINVDFAVFKNFPWGERRNLQFRFEAYNLFNRANPGNLIGNVFTSDAQPVPAVAFGRLASPARVTGVIPESALDAVDVDSAGNPQGIFLSRKYMNTGARRLQFGIKLIF